jgi:uncharacterized protein (DUF1330 family)
MIYMTQLVYIKEGAEKIFDDFENVAIPIISKYNGRLLLRIRPDKKSVIESHIEHPYEIHIIEFDAEEDFQRFGKDEERKKVLHLKDQSVTAVRLMKGVEL